MANRLDEAERLLRAAFALCDEAGATHDRARVAAELGSDSVSTGRIEQAVELMESAFAVLAADEPDADVATLAAQLGRLHFFTGEPSAGTRAHRDAPWTSPRGSVCPTVLIERSQHEEPHPLPPADESEALLRQALKIALDRDLVIEALRAYNNLATVRDRLDRPRR